MTFAQSALITRLLPRTIVSRLKFVPHIFREYLSEADFARQPEPNVIMDRGEQIAGYVEAGAEGGGMYVIHLFHAAHIAQTIDEARRVLDLACGPATQLLLTAQYHPHIEFVGVDLSDGMLGAAERRARALGLNNVSFRSMDITNLSAIASGEFDAVTSTMALHHLPSSDDLNRCLAQIAAVLPKNGGLYLGDLVRPKRRRTVEFMASSSADNQPKVFNTDFRNSMLAAFTKHDFEVARRRYLPQCNGYTTRPLRLFHLIKTKSHVLPTARRAQFVAARKRLSPRLRSDLDDLRLFFRLGGVRPDPFRASIYS